MCVSQCVHVCVKTHRNQVVLWKSWVQLSLCQVPTFFQLMENALTIFLATPKARFTLVSLSRLFVTAKLRQWPKHGSLCHPKISAAHTILAPLSVVKQTRLSSVSFHDARQPFKASLVFSPVWCSGKKSFQTSSLEFPWAVDEMNCKAHVWEQTHTGPHVSGGRVEVCFLYLGFKPGIAVCEKYLRLGSSQRLSNDANNLLNPGFSTV